MVLGLGLWADFGSLGEELRSFRWELFPLALALTALNYLLRYLRGKNPSSLRICALLDKPARRLVDIPIEYVGFTIPDQFVVGYGLDYGELYRNLRYVGVLRPSVYETK